MAAGIGLDLYKVTGKMALLWFGQKTYYVTFVYWLDIEYTLNRALYEENMSVIISMKSPSKNSKD
jgi:hypothetical protein